MLNVCSKFGKTFTILKKIHTSKNVKKIIKYSSIRKGERKKDKHENPRKNKHEKWGSK
jgi:hypothetical protein